MSLAYKYFVKACGLLPLFILASCSNPDMVATLEEESLIGPTGFYSEDTALIQQEDQNLRKKIGELFLVEQFNAKIFPSMKKAIQNHPPGGIVYWNPEGFGAYELAQINSEYSKVAEQNQLLPLLLSTDYEGGAASKSLSGKLIPGIQRFTKGFTQLPHPQWLGRAMLRFGQEVCHLQGEIMAKELKAAGINYPLATVSDRALNLFSVRGISKNPDQISSCVQEMVTAFAEEKNMIFVTKHFPGLGETVGDTHDQTVVSKASNREQLEEGLKPFRETIQFVNQSQIDKNYSILASHALFKPIDPIFKTTESKKILTDLLRHELQFKGIVISDAMWMGNYGQLKQNELLVVYLKSILAGMDLLMISGRTFAPAVQFFRDIYDGKSSLEIQARLQDATGMSYQEIRRSYHLRLKQSVERIKNVKTSLSYAHKDYDLSNYEEPKTKTLKQNFRFAEMLDAVGF